MKRGRPRGRGIGREERIQIDRQLSQTELRKRRHQERQRRMEDGRTPSEDSRVHLGASGSRGNLTGLPTTTTSGPTSVSQPGSIIQSNSTGVRDEMSFDSNDSGPLAGYSSNRDPVYHSFNPHLINHMGNPDLHRMQILLSEMTKKNSRKN